MKRRVIQIAYRTGQGKWLDGSMFYEQKKSKKRSAKYRPSSEAQQRLNEDNARRKATRLVQDNFREGVDFIIHPTYNEEFLPQTADAAKKDIRNFFNRVRRLYKKLGISAEFKYFGTAVGETKTRRHLHFVITGANVEGLKSKLKELWPFGYCNIDTAQSEDNDGLAGIVNYIISNYAKAKEDEENLFKKRWCASKNLSRPEPSECRGRISVSLLPKLAKADDAKRREILETIYPGYTAVEVDVAELNDVPDDRKHCIYGNYYIYFRMIKTITANTYQYRQRQKRLKEREER